MLLQIKGVLNVGVNNNQVSVGILALSLSIKAINIPMAITDRLVTMIQFIDFQPLICKFFPGRRAH